MYQVRLLAIMQYKDEGLTEFNRLREQRLQTLPLDLLATTPMIESSEPEKRFSKDPPATSKIVGEIQTKEQEEVQRREQEEVQRREQEETQRKEQEQSSTEVNVDA